MEAAIDELVEGVGRVLAAAEQVEAVVGPRPLGPRLVTEGEQVAGGAEPRRDLRCHPVEVVAGCAHAIAVDGDARNRSCEAAPDAAFRLGSAVEPDFASGRGRPQSDGGILDGGMGGQGVGDLVRLEPDAADLDLLVDPAEVVGDRGAAGSLATGSTVSRTRSPDR